MIYSMCVIDLVPKSQLVEEINEHLPSCIKVISKLLVGNQNKILVV